MPAIRGKATFLNFRSVLDEPFGSNHVLTVVTASVTAGVMSKSKLAILEEKYQVTKRILGVSF